MTSNPPPVFSTNYYLDGGSDSKGVLNRMEEAWREGSPLWLQFQAEADIDMRMMAGDQEAFHSYGARTYNYWKRNQFICNKLRPAIQMIAGNQIKNRKTSILIPQESELQEPADELSKILLWSMSHANSFNQISQSFEKGISVGLSLLQHWLDYTNDPVNGDVRSSVINYTQVFMDPFFKRLDLSDCRYIWTRKWLTRDHIKILLPGREKEVDSLPSGGNADGRFAYQAEAINYQQKRLLPYDEFWYQDTRKKRVMIDENSGESFEWKGKKEEKEDFLEWASREGLRVREKTRFIPTIHHAIVVQNHPLVDIESPNSLDRYPFSPFVGFFNPEIPYMPLKLQGLIRNARDMQWSYNRRVKLELDYLESGINRGYIFDESAVVNQDTLTENKGNGMHIPLKAGRDINASIQPIPPAQIPPSWFQQKEVIQRDISQMMQANEELMGQADDAKAGVLEFLRQGANLTQLAPLFNSLDESQKIVSQIHLDLIQNNWSKEKLTRILGKEVNPIIKNKYFQKFDISIVDGAMTPTQQALEFRQLTEMIAAGLLPNSPEVLEVLIKTAPIQNKDDLIKAMQKGGEAQAQQAEAQAQAEAQTAEAQIALYKSQASANQGIASERFAKVQENEALAVERIKKAQSENDKSILDQAKAIKELAGVDLEQIIQALEIIRSLAKEKEEESSKNLEPSPNSLNEGIGENRGVSESQNF